MKLVRALIEHPEVIAIGVICLAPTLEQSASQLLRSYSSKRPAIQQLLHVVPAPAPEPQRFTVRAY
ncbi:MAG: hypothetical protein ACM3ZB_03415 [bacterium]|jgi:hypothetical protein